VRPGPRGAVFLLTDYGSEDEFAGVTRAVVLREAPEAPVVDLTHGIPPFDVRAGALLLSRCVGYIGPGVVIAVVDPGVGSGRRAVAVEVPGDTGLPTGPERPRARPRYLLGPDNGLLSWAVDALGGVTAAVALPASPGATATGAAPGGSAASFDGRDLFAPVAARLWGGASLNDVGIPIDPESLVRLRAPRLEVSARAGAPEAGTTGRGGAGSVETEVLWVDRFGNVQLSAGDDDAHRAGLDDDVEVRTERSTLGARRVTSFAALGGDEMGLLVDANGQLCLVCDRRSAATVLEVRAGDMVRLGPAAP
jgi:S-adenosyl-L-methionine hydrolase (adenosine-forming)